MPWVEDLSFAVGSGKITPGYCWSTLFKVLEVLFLGKVSPALLPSKKACGAHQLRHLGVD